MKVYFDTNIIIDILERRDPFFKDSADIFLMASDRAIEGIIGAGSITDIYYIIRKSRRNHKVALDAVIDLFETLTVVDTKSRDIYSASKSVMNDFEDAVIASVAEREGAQYIITRNTDDFVNASIPAITPQNFLNLYNK
ncbi:PIN domain-containing protein [Spirochaetia bacterium]|nr:PIN domain-containing protein [Spirochaetia bacterium]